MCFDWQSSPSCVAPSSSSSNSSSVVCCSCCAARRRAPQPGWWARRPLVPPCGRHGPPMTCELGVSAAPHPIHSSLHCAAPRRRRRRRRRRPSVPLRIDEVPIVAAAVAGARRLLIMPAQQIPLHWNNVFRISSARRFFLLLFFQFINVLLGSARRLIWSPVGFRARGKPCC